MSGESGRGICGGDAGLGDGVRGGDAGLGDGVRGGDVSLGGDSSKGHQGLGGGSVSGELNEVSVVPDSSFSSSVTVSESSPATETNSLKPLSRTVRFTA
jgi:hypothetical protein